ncbi:MAG: type secretory pathway, ATPase PulE/Tfp pilus assembly pathway, ATPase PilB [Actinomycetia bacterium]|nr:type secretory pathway, ATPase PulE/Tfp pilus assembly pathway, ATPase PilB [Actinomycetes bacterium]
MRRKRDLGGQTDIDGSPAPARAPESFARPDSREEEARLIAERLAALVESRRARPATAFAPVMGARHSGRLLGNLLLTRGFLVEPELNYALARQATTGAPIGEVLVELGLISERDLVELLAEQLRMEVVDLTRVECDRSVALRLPEYVARRLGALPVRRAGERIDVVIGDPTDDEAVRELTVRLGSPLRLLLAPRADIDAAIDRLYD